MKKLFIQYAVLTGLLMATNCGQSYEQHMQNAESARKEGKFTEELKSLESAINIKKTREAYKELGNFYLTHTTDTDKAITYYTESVKIDPNYINAIHNMGLAFLKKYQYTQQLTRNEPKYLEEAKTWLDKSLSIDPNYGLTHAEMGVYYLQKKQYNDAYRHVQIAHKNKVAEWYIRYLEGKILYEQGQLEKSLEKLNLGFGLKTDEPDMLLTIAKTYRKMNATEKSQAYFGKYISLLKKQNYPDNYTGQIQNLWDMNKL